ncbi:MAG: hypothetical protein JW909_08915 [Planctomycetes bacterium]|nr:hypothetical protein [Planctomycetota bacterium]
MSSRKSAVLTSVFFLCGALYASGIYPVPREVVNRSGAGPFRMGGDTVIVALTPEIRRDIETSGLMGVLVEKYGFDAWKVKGPEGLKAALEGGGAIIAGDLASPAIAGETASLPLKVSAGHPGREGYVLDVTEKRVIVAGRDGAGTFFGLQSLKQLLSESGSISAMEVIDWPEYEMRAVYYAMEGGAPAGHVETGKRVADLAASLKYDQVCVEMSNGGYARLEMQTGENGETVAEMAKKLYDYCRERHLDARPEGRMCYFPRGEYPHPDKFAGDPTWLECIRTEERYHLAGTRAVEFTIQKWDKRGNAVDAPIPVRNVMHDIHTGRNWDQEPVVVKSIDGTVTFEEGRDYVLKFGKIKAHWAEKVHYGTGHPKGYPYQVLRWAEYAGDQEATTVARTADSRIPDGSDVLVEFSFIGPDPYSRWKYRECLSDPRLYAAGRQNPVYRLCTDPFDLIDPEIRVYGIEYDEYRTIGWDHKCLASGKTRAEICYGYVKAQVDFVLERKPGTRVVMWSDMIDPHHNAADYRLEGTAELLARNGYNKKVIAQPWHSGMAEKSVKFLSDLGYSFMPSCQGPPPDASSLKWRYYMDRLCGPEQTKSLQYTHWEGVEGWQKMLDGGNEPFMESLRTVSQAGWSIAPHIELETPTAGEGGITVTARVRGDVYHYTPAGSSGEAHVGEEAGSGGKGEVIKGPLKIEEVRLFHRAGSAGEFKPVSMTEEGGVYTATAPLAAGGGIEFYVTARDANNTKRIPAVGAYGFSSAPGAGEAAGTDETGDSSAPAAVTAGDGTGTAADTAGAQSGSAGISGFQYAVGAAGIIALITVLATVMRKKPRKAPRRERPGRREPPDA